MIDKNKLFGSIFITIIVNLRTVMAAANTKRQSYTTAEKLKVIQFAEQHGNRSAQREFGIAESNICLW